MQLRDPLTGQLRSVRAHPFAFLAMGATILLIPWTLIYITQLPDRHTTEHWNVAWTGFDLMLAAALGFTAWCALRERAMLIVGLIVTSVLLVCDAWFDLVTSLGTKDEMLTLFTALADRATARDLLRAARAERAADGDPHQPARVRGPRVARRAARGRPARSRRHALATTANAAIARVDVVVGVRGRELRADARLALRHDRIRERDDVDAVLEQQLGRRRRRGARRRTSPARSGARPARRRSRAPSSSARKRARVREEPLAQLGALALQQIEHRERSPPRSAGPACSRTGTDASAAAAARRSRGGRSCSRRSRRRAPCRACR